MTRQQILVVSWLVLASVAFVGMIFGFPAIVILLVAWAGGVVSLALVQQSFPKLADKLYL